MCSGGACFLGLEDDRPFDLDRDLLELEFFRLLLLDRPDLRLRSDFPSPPMSS